MKNHVASMVAVISETFVTNHQQGARLISKATISSVPGTHYRVDDSMNESVTVMRDPDNRKQVLIYSSDDSVDPWDNLAILLEGVGVLVAACANNGKISHNEQSVEDYLKSYIGKVCNDYEASRPLSQRN